MSEMSVSDEQLSLLLQASREFAFGQMAAGERLLPFATRVRADGEIEFIRFAEDGTTQPLEEIYAFTREAMAREAREGTILAASLVASVELGEPEEGCDKAIRIHMEAPGFCRQILSPYAVGEVVDGKAQVTLGQLVPLSAEAEIFTA